MKEYILNTMAVIGAIGLLMFPNCWTLGILIATSVAIGTYEVLSN